MAVRQITTRLSTDGEAEYKRQMSDATRAIQTQKTELQLLEAQFKGQMNTTDALTEKDRILRAEIEQQQEKVKALAQAVVDASAAYGDADKRTDGYRQSLNRAQRELIEMNRELEQTEKYLDEAAKSADGTASSIDGFGKEMKDLDGAGTGLGNIVGKLGELKGFLMGGALTVGAKEAYDWMADIVDSTEEYRKAMGTLEVASQAAGYSAEQTYEIYGRLHSVMGDTQAAAEATTQLQALKVSHDDLNLASYITIGMWTELGQASPVESIAESVQQTVAAGQATGALSDYLMAAKINEDDFNAALQQCTSSTERADLVLKILSTQGLASVGQAWLETNDDIVKANETQERWNESMGRLGELFSPIVNGIRNLGADGIDWLVDKIEAVIPVLEGMAEVATKVWDAVKGDDTENAFTRGQYGSRSVDGSHAGGLECVPFDGYIAELHHGERVQTREEADWWRAMQAGIPTQQTGITAADLQSVTAAAVNAINLGRGREQIVIEAKWVVNGREFYADTIDDLRAVNRSNPEVTDDR